MFLLVKIDIELIYFERGMLLLVTGVFYIWTQTGKEQEFFAGLKPGL
jgi:hypothetical protein